MSDEHFKKVCPWCGEIVEPLRTAEHLNEAAFQYSAKTPDSIRLNPVMCPICYGVGGYDDFYSPTSDEYPTDTPEHCAELRMRTHGERWGTAGEKL